MTAENTEMLPCPLCGADVQIMEIKPEWASCPQFYDISCECGLSIGKDEDRPSLLERWNRRADIKVENFNIVQQAK